MTDAGTDAAVIHYSSVSQVQSFELCARKWWFDKVQGTPQPTSAAQAIGTDGHSQLETYLATGVSANLGRMARAGAHFLPTPAPGVIEVERAIHGDDSEPLTAGGVVFRGFIDVLNRGSTWRDDDGRDHPLDDVEVIDWKFMGDIIWAKNPAQLAESTQMLGYAEWARRNFELSAVRVSHGSFQMRGAARAKKTSALISAETVKESWQKIEGTVASMMVAARASRADDVPPTYSACGAFGGCHYRSVCPRTPGAAVRQLFGVRREKGDGMSLLDKYRKKMTTVEPTAEVAAEVEKLVAEEAAAALTPAQIEANKAHYRAGGGNENVPHPPRGVLPPDAPKSEPPKSAVALPADAAVSEEIRAVAAAWVEKTETAEEATSKKAKKQKKLVDVTITQAPAAIQEMTAVPETAFRRTIIRGALDAELADSLAKVEVKPPALDAALDVVVDTVASQYNLSCKHVEDLLSAPATTSLFVDVVVSGTRVTDLEPYVVSKCRALEAEFNAIDIRCAPSDGPLGFGKWKGALAAVVRAEPPTPGMYVLHDVKGSEIREVVVEALRPLCAAYVRGR